MIQCRNISYLNICQKISCGNNLFACVFSNLQLSSARTVKSTPSHFWLGVFFYLLLWKFFNSPAYFL